MKTLKKNIVILNVLKMIHKRKKKKRQKEGNQIFITNDVFSNSSVQSLYHVN